MNSEPDQIDMMDADELRVELRKLVQQIIPPPERGSQPHSVGWSEWVGELEAERRKVLAEMDAHKRSGNHQKRSYCEGVADGLYLAIMMARRSSPTSELDATVAPYKAQSFRLFRLVSL